MAKFSISISITQPLEIVWNAFIDPQNMLHWTRYLERVEIIEGKFGEIGAKSHLHYLEKGRSYILEDKLIGYDEKKRIISQITGQGMNIEVETLFEVLPNGTKISTNWNGTSKSIIMRVMFRLLIRKITKQAKKELLHFKRLVETHGSKF